MNLMLDFVDRMKNLKEFLILADIQHSSDGKPLRVVSVMVGQ